MPARHEPNVSAGDDLTNALKNWMMVALTLIFVLLYGAALTGWLKPLTDEKMVSRLEPIIFVIIGYYFGRLPAQQNEKTLKEEITRQTQKADASQHAKEQAQQSREALEERMKNVRASLIPIAEHTSGVALDQKENATGRVLENDNLRHSVSTALHILNS